MPRSVTALSGHYADADQVAVTLVYLQIPSNTLALCDLDVPVYLNPSTNAVSMVAGAGLVQFLPAAGLEVPEIENAEERITTNVTLSLANENGAWFSILGANVFREAPATVWQGNLLMTPGTAPDAVTFVGAVKTWNGRIEFINATRDKATVELSPHITPFTILFPYRTFSAPEFRHMPAPGSKVVWGFTEREL
jgi:hypothetical protein